MKNLMSGDENEAPADAPHFFSINRKMTLKELSITYIEFLLSANNNSRDKTFHELGIDRKTLYRKLSAGPSARLKDTKPLEETLVVTEARAIARASSECD
jgi:DNA-binding NtrC family response regulator